MIKCYCGHTINCDCEVEQETLEEAAEKYSYYWENITGLVYEDEYPSAVNKLDFINGAKWQQKNSYSEEEVKNIANWAFGFYKRNDLSDDELENEFNRILAKKFKKK